MPLLGLVTDESGGDLYGRVYRASELYKIYFQPKD